MSYSRLSADRLLSSLQERSKELRCFYAVEELLKNLDAEVDDICQALVQVIPHALQYPELGQVQIELADRSHGHLDLPETPWKLHAEVLAMEKRIGSITVCYPARIPADPHCPFLGEERKLIGTIASRLGHFLACHQMRHIMDGLQAAREMLKERPKQAWRIILDLLRQTDPDLYFRIAHKMLNHLYWIGVAAAHTVMPCASSESTDDGEGTAEEPNCPRQHAAVAFPRMLSEEVFRIAAEHLSDDEILQCVQKWIQEDKLSFLVQMVNRHLSLPVVADAIRRYQHLSPALVELPSPARRGIEVALCSGSAKIGHVGALG